MDGETGRGYVVVGDGILIGGCGSRLYLGMHSPIDIFGGIVVALLLLGFFIPLEGS